MARVAAETKTITQMGTESASAARTLRTVELIQSGALGEITEVHATTDRPIWPQGYDRPPGQDVPAARRSTGICGWGPRRMRPYLARYPEGHPVYDPAPGKRHQSDFKDAELSPVPPLGVVYHPFVWRGWTEFGSGALGDIAPHSLNVMFWALDLGAPSAVEVIETSGMKREMYPDWSVIRFEWAARGVHPPLKIYWYDGGKQAPASIGGRPRLDRHQGQPAGGPRAISRTEDGPRRPAAAAGLGPRGSAQGLGGRPSGQVNRRAATSATRARSPKRTNSATSPCASATASNGTRLHSGSRTAVKRTRISAASTGADGISARSRAALHSRACDTKR